MPATSTNRRPQRTQHRHADLRLIDARGHWETFECGDLNCRKIIKIYVD